METLTGAGGIGSSYELQNFPQTSRRLTQRAKLALTQVILLSVFSSILYFDTDGVFRSTAMGWIDFNTFQCSLSV